MIVLCAFLSKINQELIIYKLLFAFFFSLFKGKKEKNKAEGIATSRGVGGSRAEHHLPCLWVGSMLISYAGEGVGLCC